MEEEDGWLTERVHSSGRPVRIVTKVDGPRFSEFWMGAVAQTRSLPKSGNEGRIPRRRADTEVNARESAARSAGPSSPGHYLVQPAFSTGKGVLVLHAWWDLDRFIKGLCDRLAAQGYLALAPDLYHGATASTIEGAKALRGRLKQATVREEIAQAAEQLRSACGAGQGALGVVGFSLGGYWALWLADQAPCPVAATVVFYGSRHGDYAGSRSAFQLHLAESDDYVAASAVSKLQRALRAAGRVAEFHTYPGTGHWFFEHDRPDAYDAQAAGLAWGRTVEFLRKHVR